MTPTPVPETGPHKILIVDDTPTDLTPLAATFHHVQDCINNCLLIVRRLAASFIT